MAGSRPSLFEEDDIDLSGFAPSTAPDPTPVPPATIRQVSEEGGFPSRAARKSMPEAVPKVDQMSAKRQPLVYRTGRNVTFSAKTTLATVEAFYEIARAQGWKAGETFERAIAALQETLR